MKRLILVLLLVIFSAQGLGLAAGVNILNASLAFAHLEKGMAQSDAGASTIAKSALDTDGLKILSIAEELSDYVMLDPALPTNRHHAPSVSTAAWIPVSVFLPTSLPPPRSFLPY